jgi:hypothetical protein
LHRSGRLCFSVLLEAIQTTTEDIKHYEVIVNNMLEEQFATTDLSTGADAQISKLISVLK